MVTQTEAELAVSAKLEKDKWDLVDLEKRDEWLLKTNAALNKDKAVWTALENGPPTAEMIKQKNPKLSTRQCEDVLPQLMKEYRESNEIGWRILIDRVSFRKRPALATKVLRDLEPTEDGHGFWQVVRESLDESSPEKQASAEMAYSHVRALR